MSRTLEQAASSVPSAAAAAPGDLIDLGPNVLDGVVPAAAVAAAVTSQPPSNGQQPATGEPASNVQQSSAAMGHRLSPGVSSGLVARKDLRAMTALDHRMRAWSSIPAVSTVDLYDVVRALPEAAPDNIAGALVRRYTLDAGHRAACFVESRLYSSRGRPRDVKCASFYPSAPWTATTRWWPSSASRTG